MLSKQKLKDSFSKDWKKHYEVELFREKGYERRICKSCGKPFWTLDSERDTCADSPCQNYDFINDTITKGKWDYIETWRMFERFFEKNSHTSIPRYPVVDRWRPDLFFTIASIQDFQRLDNGEMNFVYPANPLVVPQVCLRFPDIQNVGITGRHLTSFIMSGQHAFGHPKEKGAYFKDRCIELNFKFLSGEMGIPEEELVYMEDCWAMPDFSAFGPSMETFSRGLELVNSVFMQFQANPDDTFRGLDKKVIDVGWGHERLVWFSNGTPASYDSLFGPVTKDMKKRTGIKVDEELFGRYSLIAGSLDMNEVKDIRVERKKVAKQVGIDEKELMETIEPLQAVYAIADHTRTLLFATTDGGIPSNVGGGYNLRAILRRALSFMDKYDFDFRLMDIAEMHAKYLKPMFPELSTELDNMSNIIELEKKKYQATRKNTERIVKTILEKGGELKTPKLKTLYESHGISPEDIRKYKPDFEVPPDFYSQITDEHSVEKAEDKKKEFDVSDMPDTKKLFYDDIFEFEAKVLKKAGDYVILDKTAFYATSGGQHHDTGTLNGKDVTDVIKQGNVILHKVGGDFNQGEKVQGVVDKKRRRQLAQNHSAVHIINGAAQKVLGSHIWQCGSEVAVDKARLDITHYDLLTKKELDEIEEEANKAVEQGIKIEKIVMERGKAEQTFGFRLYQGGAIPETHLRIIKMGDFDVEACGGTHCDEVTDVGKIKILRSTKVQDGVIRLEFAAGGKAEEQVFSDKTLFSGAVKLFEPYAALQDKYDPTQLYEVCKTLSVQKPVLLKTLKRFLDEWKNYTEFIGAESKLNVAKNLFEATKILFSEWKKNGKEFKKALGVKIQQELSDLPDDRKLRGIFYGLRMKDLTEDSKTPLEKTLEKAKKIAGS